MPNRDDGSRLLCQKYYFGPGTSIQFHAFTSKSGLCPGTKEFGKGRVLPPHLYKNSRYGGALSYVMAFFCSVFFVKRAHLNLRRIII